MAQLTGWSSVEVTDTDMCNMLTAELCSFGALGGLRVRGVEKLSSGGFRVNLRPVEEGEKPK